jgi:surface protein
MKKILAFSALLSSLLLTSCIVEYTPTEPTPPSTPVATSITLSETSLSFASLGDTTQLAATVTDVNDEVIDGATVTWAATGGAATVSSAGLVTPVANGTATVTATSGSASATATVTVSQAAASVELSDTVLSFTSLGDTTQLTATVTEANDALVDGATVTWATTGDAATVSSAGLVTAVANGTAMVTATSGSASATASVYVAAQFSLAANGVTVMCPDADVGQTGKVNGIVYTKRSKAQIGSLVDGRDYGPLATTCTSSVTKMHQIFGDATLFNGDISSWDVSNVTEMSGIFQGATSFNGDINSWNVGSVTDMRLMFHGATSFNQDLSGWCVSNIASEPTAFDDGTTSWVLARPVWGTCPS